MAMTEKKELSFAWRVLRSSTPYFATTFFVCLLITAIAPCSALRVNADPPAR